MTELERIAQDPISRRQFLARMSAAGLGVAAVTLLAGCGGGSNGGGSSNSNNNNSGGGNAAFALPSIVGGGLVPGSGDTQVLNYALALETTEADIYRQALNIASNLPVTTPLSASGPAAYGTTYPGGNPGTLTGANANVAYLYLAQYAFVEAAHRDLLLTALHHSADNPSLPTTANTTNPVVNPNGYKFLPTTNSLSDIMALILTAEETGVTAYLGAVPYLSSLGNIQTAATIYSTEARHSAGVRYVFNDDIGPGNLTPIGTVSTGPFVSGSAQPRGTSGATNEFEYALAPAFVLNNVVATFYNVPNSAGNRPA